MQKLIALILSVIMAFLNLIPGFSDLNKDTMEVGEWLALANETFGMTYDPEGDVYEGIEADDEAYEAVQTAYQWGILEGFEINPDAAVDAQFAAVALVRYAKLTGGKVQISNADVLEFAEEVAIAVANGIFDLDESLGFFAGKLTRDEAIAAINKAFEIWSNKEIEEEENESNFELADGVVDMMDGNGYEMVGQSIVLEDSTVAVGDTVALEEGVYTVAETYEDGAVAKVEEAEIEDGYESVNMTASMDPNLALAEVRDGEGNLLKEAVDEETLAEQWELKDLITWDLIYDLLLDYAEISFDIGDIEVEAKLVRDGFQVTFGGEIVDGVHVSRSYKVTNLHLDSKFKANIAALKINEAYLIADYNCVETTIIKGSYAANLVELEGEEAIEKSFFEKVKEGLFKFTKGSGKRIVLYNVDIPIPNLPGFTFTIQFGVQLNVSGRIEIVVTSQETKGYEVINNRGRVISETTVTDRDVTAYGNFKLMFYADFILAFAGYDLLDVALKVGVAADIKTYIYVNGYTDQYVDNTEENTIIDQDTGELIIVDDLALDVAVEAATIYTNYENLALCSDIKMYFVVTISVGEGSLLEKIGLDQSWDLVDEDNGTFLDVHVEDGNIVEECTRPDAKAA